MVIVNLTQKCRIMSDSEIHVKSKEELQEGSKEKACDLLCQLNLKTQKLAIEDLNHPFLIRS